MINKPITLQIQLSYSQALMVLKQLQYEIDREKQPDYNRKPRLDEVQEEINSFKKWKENNK